MNPISVISVVHNEAEYLAERYRELQPYVDEFVVIDQGSTDDTVKVARQFTHKVFLFPRVYYMFAYMAHAALMARNEWVLQCSPDEEWDGELLGMLGNLILRGYDAVRFPVVYADTPPDDPICYGFRLWRRGMVLWTDSYDAVPYNLDSLRVLDVPEHGRILNLRTRESAIERYRMEGAKRLLARYGDTDVEPYANFCAYYHQIIEGKQT